MGTAYNFRKAEGGARLTFRSVGTEGAKVASRGGWLLVLLAGAWLFWRHGLWRREEGDVARRALATMFLAAVLVISLSSTPAAVLLLAIAGIDWLIFRRRAA